MLFTDDDARHSFHTSSTLLQVVCQMLESELTQHHMQLEFIDVDKVGEMWEALLVVASETFEGSTDQQEAFKHAVTMIDARFVRQDGAQTVTAEAGNYGLITIRVTDATELAQVN